MQMDSIGLLGNMFAVAKNLCRGALSLLAESYTKPAREKQWALVVAIDPRIQGGMLQR